ncbi:MAG: threonine--tRNA ligase [Candidatus Micrarchaeota archaeon]|nr:threonine--tRNA ligase [Candidatus Micrarchaeota archaeon]
MADLKNLKLIARAESSTNAFELAKKLKIELKDIVAIKIDGKLYDLNKKIEKDQIVEFVKNNSPEGLEVLRHSCAHVMAQAIVRLYKDAKLTIGPVVEDGFYYDIYREKPFELEDIKKIEQEMKQIIEEDQPFERVEVSKQKAKELYKDNKYKLEIIEELDENQPISIYYNRKTSKSPAKEKEFFDLCTGPHVPSTCYIKAFKILKVAGAYWRANAANDQLQRIYGTCFATKQELDQYLERLEKAALADHRKLGKELNLIMFSEMAPGMVFFLPDGYTIRQELENFIRQEQQKLGYKEVRTPIIINTKVWQISGHWDHYKDNMYFTKIDEQNYGIKPMNCPGHMLIFANSSKSYRDLPLKISEFGLVHRHELSGVLSGMTRVRAFTQDDAHIFCTDEQIEEVVIEVLDLIQKVLNVFGFEYRAELSTRPEKYMGELKLWQKAEEALKNALKKSKLDYSINEGDGAFYGPKIDFKVKDALGRVWQLSTCQLDFQMPIRFELKYEGKDGRLHHPVVIHRAIYGSFERFIAILIEHYAGKFPIWLCPTQVILLAVAEKHLPYCLELEEKIKKEKIRVETYKKEATINLKIREAQLRKIPYMIVIGDREVSGEKLTIRKRNGQQLKMSLEEFIAFVKNKIENKEND